MKLILSILFFVLFIFPIVLADYTVGQNIGGDEWDGNSTLYNSTIVQSTDNIEAKQLIDDYFVYLRFDEGAGTTVKNENTSGSDLTLTTGVNWTTGMYGNGYFFNGSTANYGLLPRFNTDNVTICMWVKMNSTKGHYFIDNADSTGGWHGWRFYTDNSNNYRSYIYLTTTGDSLYVVDGALSTNVWKHITMTYNSSNMRLYLNGSYNTQDTGTGSLTHNTTPTSFVFGMSIGVSNPMDGIMDDVRIYDYALSETEITQVRDNEHRINGNTTVDYNANDGNVTYNMVINATGNWSGYYRENATGNFVTHVSNQNGNQSVVISGITYQHTDYRVKFLDNDDQELIGVTFNEQSAGGTSTPISLDYTRSTTWINWTWAPGTNANDTDSYNYTINETWYNGSTNEYYNHTGLSIGIHSEIILYAWNSTYNELSSGYVTNNVSTLGSTPAVTGYYPIVTIWPEVTDSQLFNVTVDQNTQCRWYINGSLVQTNSSLSTTHSYTNLSLNGGHWNFTAVVNNTNGTDSQTWIFEVGADSITYILLQHDPTNKSMIDEFNVTRIGSNVTDWGFYENYTFSGWTYFYRYTNGTEIMNQTATSNNESLWFNGTSLLPTGVYFINATEAAVNTSTIIIPANSYGMVNNWTVATNFSNIAANESNDVAYSYYNVTTGEWESHYSPYSWNSDYVIPLEASVMVFVNAETTVTATIVTPSSTELYTGWNMLYIQGTDNESVSSIIADIGANCTDAWYFNSTAGDYSNTSSDTIQPCQGFIGYITQDMLWVRSDL